MAGNAPSPDLLHGLRFYPFGLRFGEPAMELTLEQMKANRKLWVEALRSGKYEQTTGDLHNHSGYCCLGVLALCAGKDAGDICDKGALLDFPEVMGFVGLREDEGGFATDDGETEYLAGLNDNGATFAEIADIIESEPSGLFIESVQP